jgi:Fuc2NAc and GlcNAc transferase
MVTACATYAPGWWGCNCLGVYIGTVHAPIDWIDDFPVFLAITGGGALIALIGFMDDQGHIAACWRLLGHFNAAIGLLFWIDGFPAIELFGHAFDLGWFGHVLCASYLVWLLNLYNFMDGIDGIASINAICACLGACLLYWVNGAADLIWAPLLLAAAVAGLLCWSFPPAKIFMCDAGSGFRGLSSEGSHFRPPGSPPICCGVG